MFTVRIEEVIEHNERYSTVIFDRSFRAYPGQFIMLNVFGYEEIPLSLSSENSVTVKAVGDTTRYLVKIKPGTMVGVKGPMGNPFSPTKGRALLIAAGIGAAPLSFLYRFLQNYTDDIEVLYAARSSDDLIFLDTFENCKVATEDGSFGEKGTIFDLVYSEDLDRYDKIYACGPEVVLRGLHAYFRELGVENKAEMSLERYMKCGIGVCGSCVMGNGVRVCVEGPVFRCSEIVW